MAQDKVKIGHDIANKVDVYLVKHEFCCDDHWIFGWVDSKDYHTHLDNYNIIFSFHPDGVTLKNDMCEIKITEIDPNKFGVIFDLYLQAYALADVSNIYSRGHGGIVENKHGLKRDLQKRDELNKIIGDIINKAWELLVS